MNITAVKTKRFKYPGNSADDLLSCIPRLKNKSIVILSSKALSVCNGDVVDMDKISHAELIKRIADEKLEPVQRKKDGPILTKVGNLLVESAGIDKSPRNHYYITLLSNPKKLAFKIWKLLKAKNKINNLGIVISDSHSLPARKGAIGLAIATYGFKPVAIYSEVTMADIADGIAAAGVLEMGESTENTPIAVAENVHNAEFYKKIVPLNVNSRYSWVDPQFDVYAPLLDNTKWSRNLK